MRGSLFVALLACAVTAACNPRDMAAGRGEAEKAVVEFHARFDEGRYGEIYDSATDELRGSIDRAKFLELLGAIQRKLGKVAGSENRGWRVNSWNFRTRVELAQATRFETGAAQETFSFVVRDGEAKLLNYNINSPDLVIR